MGRFRAFGPALLLAASVACAQPFSGPAIAIAHDGKGVGFDDLQYSAALGRVLVPAGRTGTIVMIDPATGHTTAVSGLTKESSYGGGHDEGTTSVDEGNGLLYAIDRTSRQVVAIDPAARRITARTALAASPDYVRFVPTTGELWVTEPDAEQIEVFTVRHDPLSLARAAVITVRGGPESLVIDPGAARAYTHLWSGATVVIDLHSRSIKAKWPNRCEGSRGIALDERSHFVFAGCAEGKAVVMDARDGAVLATAPAGAGVDIIAFDPVHRRLYVPGARSATMTVFSVAANGALTALLTTPTARGAHCVATDGTNAYVCDPDRGRILVVGTSAPAVK